MSSNDPRIIAVALEDLIQEIGLWSSTASQTIDFADQTQRHARENAETALHRAAVTVDEAQQDGERANQIMTRAEEMVDRVESGVTQANATIARAEQEIDHANSTLSFWEAELSSARAWLRRAEARLARAQVDYDRARQAVYYAQSELDRAQSRYRACMNDRERQNCNSEARAVNAAQAELRQAQYDFQAAQAELIAATEEVNQARARVECCSRAVDFASQAVTVALEAESHAAEALSSIQRSFDFAKAAAQNALVAKGKAFEEIDTARQMLAASENALASTSTAALRLTTADNAAEQAQRYVMNGRYNVEYRLQMLRQFDLPELRASSGHVGLAVPAGVAVAAKPTSPSKWADRGIQFVNVSDLPDPDGISGAADFRKISEPEMRAGIEKLSTMRPMIESGVGASANYWAEYDRKQGHDYSSGYQRVYDAFYGQDCIKLNKDSNTYDVDNGRHRIWLAKQMGVKQLPARIVELKADG
jgi:hypothetical protein